MNGNMMSPSATGSAPEPKGCCDDCIFALLDKVTVKVTLVPPDPAETDAGENAADAPAGRPLTVRLIACGNVSPLGGTNENE
jgi:hypothetical protein